MFTPAMALEKPVYYTDPTPNKARSISWASDSFPNQGSNFSRVGEMLLTPLDICGHKWADLKWDKCSGLIDKICYLFQRILLILAIPLALIPAVGGSLIKCGANPPLKPASRSCFTEWNIPDASKEQQAQCKALGLYDFNTTAVQADIALRNILKTCPEFPKWSSIGVIKDGHKDYPIYSIYLTRQSLGVKRPHGNSFLQNISNCFLPEKQPSIPDDKINLLTDLFLGIKSGTEKDYIELQTLFSACTKIKFTIEGSLKPDAHEWGGKSIKIHASWG